MTVGAVILVHGWRSHSYSFTKGNATCSSACFTYMPVWGKPICMCVCVPRFVPFVRASYCGLLSAFSSSFYGILPAVCCYLLFSSVCSISLLSVCLVISLSLSCVSCMHVWVRQDFVYFDVFEVHLVEEDRCPYNVHTA